MKLKNKKTGEIIELLAKPSFVKRENDFLQGKVNTFSSLAELNEEWEDYEEPKKYYYLDYGGRIKAMNDANDEEDMARKAIGNYFETKEEAEKAVERLRAWKRLKDKGFRFNGWNGTRVGSNISYISAFYYEGCPDDMDLLFSWEDD